MKAPQQYPADSCSAGFIQIAPLLSTFRLPHSREQPVKWALYQRLGPAHAKYRTCRLARIHLSRRRASSAQCMIPASLPIGLLHSVRFRNFCLNARLRSDLRSGGTQSGHPSTIAAKLQQAHRALTPRQAAASLSERSFPKSRLCDLNESSDASCWRLMGTSATPTDVLP